MPGHGLHRLQAFLGHAARKALGDPGRTGNPKQGFFLRIDHKQFDYFFLARGRSCSRRPISSSALKNNRAFIGDLAWLFSPDRNVRSKYQAFAFSRPKTPAACFISQSVARIRGSLSRPGSSRRLARPHRKVTAKKHPLFFVHES